MLKLQQWNTWTAKTVMIINLITAISSKTSRNPKSDDTCTDEFHLEVRKQYFKKINELKDKTKNCLQSSQMYGCNGKALGFLQSLTLNFNQT